MRSRARACLAREIQGDSMWATLRNTGCLPGSLATQCPGGWASSRCAQRSFCSSSERNVREETMSSRWYSIKGASVSDSDSDSSSEKLGVSPRAVELLLVVPRLTEEERPAVWLTPRVVPAV